MNAPSCRKSRGKWLLWLALVLPFSAANVAANVGIFAGAAQQDLAPNQPGISLEKALDIVRRKYGGRVLSATPVNSGDKKGFNVRMLLDGKKVKKVFVDSQGRVKSN